VLIQYVTWQGVGHATRPHSVVAPRAPPRSIPLHPRERAPRPRRPKPRKLRDRSLRSAGPASSEARTRGEVCAQTASGVAGGMPFLTSHDVFTSSHSYGGQAVRTHLV